MVRNDIRFAKAIIKVGVIASVIFALLFILLGVSILLYPQIVLQVLLCFIGGVLLISGVAIIGGLVLGLVT